MALNIFSRAPTSTNASASAAAGSSSNANAKATRRGAYGEIPYIAAVTTYLGYAVLIVFGYLRDSLSSLHRFLFRTHGNNDNDGLDKLPPLLSDFEDFYTRRLYDRIHDCWGRPIKGTAGAWINVLERVADRAYAPPPPAASNHSQQQQVIPPPPLRRNPLPQSRGRKRSHCTSARENDDPVTSPNAPNQLTGRVHRCLNLGSYNYLGYADVPGGVHTSVKKSLRERGVAACDTAASTGRMDVVRELEREVAQFLRKEDSVVVGMGFATNSMLIPAIVGRGDLIISDALNHASIVVGARASGAKIRVFEHNSAESLEQTLKDAICTGQPRTGEPWKKILIVVEGMYSMEGETPRLREIVAVKKKYGAYLYLDEAHSIGALGATGRGVCEHHGVNTDDVEIMMGTFTKSFGAVGGYIAGDHNLVARIRAYSAASLYASAMAPACAQHIIWTFRQICGKDGTNIGAVKIKTLRENAIYFRKQLAKRGMQTLGDWDSPVIPIMLYNPAKIAAFSRECLSRGLALVVVGFPATPLLLSRARICLSAAHTREDLDWALEVIDEVAELIQIKYNRSIMERILPKSLLKTLFGKNYAEQCAPHIDGHELCIGNHCLVEDS